MSADSPAGQLAITPSVAGSYTSKVLPLLASTNFPSMYIWYRATSDFRVLPLAAAVLVIRRLRPAAGVVYLPVGFELNLPQRHRVHRGHRAKRFSLCPRCPLCLCGELAELRPLPS